MANGSEVTKKVKDAIKAKLVELGAYVDDELPDYIMVLVANKKTKDQMDEDLSLFLGHNTERFTSWLHGVLQKLNAASFLQAPVQTENTEDNKEDADLMKERLELKKEKAEKRKDKKEKRKKKSKKDKKKAKKEEKAARVSHTAPPTAVEGDQLPAPDLPPDSAEEGAEEADVLDIQADPQELTFDSDEGTPAAERAVASIKRTIRQKVSLVEEQQPDNNKNHPASDRKLSIRDRLGPSKLVKKSIEPKEEPNLTLKSTIEMKTGMGRVLSSSIASAVRSVTQTDRSGRVQTKLEARVKPLMSERMKRHLSEDEGTPVQQSKKSPKLTSVVRPVGTPTQDAPPKMAGLVTKVEAAPRPRRTGSGQANTALIMRAVADAHKSVNRPASASVKRAADDQADQSPPKKRKQIFTKAFQANDQIAGGREDRDGGRAKVRKIAITVPNAHAPRDVDSDDEKQTAADDVDSDADTLKYGLTDNPLPGTRFIITMDGMQEKNIKGRLGTKRDSSLEDEYIEEVEEWEEVEEASVTAEATPPEKVKKQSIAIPGAKTDDVCKFYPDCKEGLSCRFTHPTNVSKTCVMFPSCKFGSKCLYRHPQCKFDSACTKPNCPFSHTAKPATQTLGGSTSMIKCRFFPKCTDMNCLFMHPKQPCRFGNFCKTLNCPYIHPEVTYGSKLKWIAPKTAQPVAEM